MDTKICCICKEELPTCDFHTRRYVDRLSISYACRECIKQQRRDKKAGIEPTAEKKPARTLEEGPETKFCNYCKTTKYRHEFPTRKMGNKIVLGSYCKPCGTIYSRERYRKKNPDYGKKFVKIVDGKRQCARCKLFNPVEEFQGMKNGELVIIRSYCRQCRREQEVGRKQHTEYRKVNWETRKNEYLSRIYKITLQDYEDMLTEQDGCCKICGIERSKMKRSFSVDHCHTTGKVRGLLCDACNQGLGHFKDSTEILHRAIEYLEASRKTNGNSNRH